MLIWIQCVLLDVEIAGIVSWLNPRSTHFAQSHGVVGFPLMPSHSAVFRCRPVNEVDLQTLHGLCPFSIVL